MPVQRNVKPRYEVHKIDRMVRETHYRRTEDGINEGYEIDVPYGYDVYFPAGHSIRVRTNAELQRLGFARPADLIDMESGESVGRAEPVSLRRAVESRANTAGNVRARQRMTTILPPDDQGLELEPQEDADA